MAVEVVAVAASGAMTTLVSLAVTDMWGRTRERVSRVLGRNRSTASTADEELRSAFEEFAASLGADDGSRNADRHARGDAADRLRRRLRQALHDDSATARELVALLRGLEGGTAAVPVEAVAYGVPPALRSVGPPAQIPAMRTPFVNRVRELADLNGPSDGAGHVDLRVLAGPPGVGKSALARHYAHTSGARFPGGHLYVDYAAWRGRTEALGADVSDALGHCLRSLGVDEAVLPQSLAERTALFRDRTSRLRVLLVLENVTSPAQVRALIPRAPGSAVVATSTAKLGELALDGARPLPLDPLSTEAAVLLLADRCRDGRVDAEPEAARRVAGLCSGLPVALHVAGARLSTDRRLSVAALADELADEARRFAALKVRGESPVSVVLDASYRRLAPESAHGYRLLSWIPGPSFDTATAAAALGTAPGQAQVLVDVLEDMSLLECGPDRRYRFHGIIRAHAREHARAEEPPGSEAAVVGRVLTHTLALTAFADRAVRADRLRLARLDGLLAGRADPFAAPGGPAPLDWLEAERPSVLAVLRAADEHGLHTEGWQLAEAFTALFLHHRHLGDWRESLELGARYARKADAADGEARLRSLLSRPLLDLGEHEQAQRELEVARTLAGEADHTVLRASTLEFTGRYWHDTGDPGQAIPWFRRSWDLNTVGGEPRGAALATHFLGRSQAAAGDPATALDTLRQARTELLALPKGPDHRMAARVTADIGRVLDRLGRTDDAEAELRGAAAALRECEAYAYEAEALLDLASLAERPGADRTRLCEDLRRALAVHEEMGSPRAGELRARLRDAEGGQDA